MTGSFVRRALFAAAPIALTLTPISAFSQTTVAPFRAPTWAGEFTGTVVSLPECDGSVSNVPYLVTDDDDGEMPLSGGGNAKLVIVCDETWREFSTVPVPILVSELPTCRSGTRGQVRVVSDDDDGQMPISGGGSFDVPVVCRGDWTKIGASADSVSASGVLFSDTESLQEKFDNGEVASDLVEFWVPDADDYETNRNRLQCVKATVDTIYESASCYTSASSSSAVVDLVENSTPGDPSSVTTILTSTLTPTQASATACSSGCDTTFDLDNQKATAGQWLCLDISGTPAQGEVIGCTVSGTSE